MCTNSSTTESKDVLDLPDLIKIGQPEKSHLKGFLWKFRVTSEF